MDNIGASMIAISLEEYNDLKINEYRVNKIISVLKNDKSEYGFSCETERFITMLLNVEKGSAANE